MTRLVRSRRGVLAVLLGRRRRARRPRADLRASSSRTRTSTTRCSRTAATGGRPLLEPAVLTALVVAVGLGLLRRTSMGPRPRVSASSSWPRCRSACSWGWSSAERRQRRPDHRHAAPSPRSTTAWPRSSLVGSAHPAAHGVARVGGQPAIASMADRPASGASSSSLAVRAASRPRSHPGPPHACIGGHGIRAPPGPASPSVLIP